MDQPIKYQVYPTWWTGQSDSTWDRVREAFRRDWEQTKANLGFSTARDLRQDATHTIKQALGLEPLPFRHQPNPRRWKRDEHLM